MKDNTWIPWWLEFACTAEKGFIRKIKIGWLQKWYDEYNYPHYWWSFKKPEGFERTI